MVSAAWVNDPSSQFSCCVSACLCQVDLIHNDSSPGSDEVWQVAERVLIGPAPDDLELFRSGFAPRTAQDIASNVSHARGSVDRGGGVRCTGCGPRTYTADADREGYT